eukprot:scaffold53745_cov66-Phaeocystis_antarctica.AAC.2
MAPRAHSGAHTHSSARLARGGQPVRVAEQVSEYSLAQQARRLEAGAERVPRHIVPHDAQPVEVRGYLPVAGIISTHQETTSGGNGGSRFQCLVHGSLSRGAGRDAVQVEPLEGRQLAAVERSGEGGAAGVGDLGVVEVELLELLQPSGRRRRRTCRQWRHEGGEALVAERVARETDSLQRGQPPQGRREGHQPRVADGGAVQKEVLEPRQGTPAQGGGERRGACVANMHIHDTELGHGRQRARA